MSEVVSVAVSSTSFSKNKTLRGELEQRFPNCRYNPDGRNLSADELIQFFSGADAAIVGTESITEFVVANSPSLKIISKYGVGLDNVDVDFCKKSGIVVGWTGGVNKTAVAEMVVGYMITLSRHMFQTSLELRSGMWNKNGGRQLANLIIGIIGLGHVGQDVVRLLQPFGCQVIATDIADRQEFAARNTITLVDLDTVLRLSDIITIHTPLTPDTHHLIRAQTLRLMKPSAILINTSRGQVVDQDALVVSLKEQRIHAAALDVFAIEPDTTHEILSLPNVFCTPHIGGNSVEAVVAMGRSAIGHLDAFFEK